MLLRITITHFTVSVLLILFATTISFSQSIENNFLLEITPIESPYTVAVLEYKNFHGKSVADTAKMQNGSITFSGTINKVSKAWLYIYKYGTSTAENKDATRTFETYLEEGKVKLSIDSSYILISVEGSKTHKQLDSLQKTLNTIETIHKNDLGLSSKDSSSISLLDARIQARINFVKTHSNSYLSPEIISFLYSRREIGIDTAQVLFESLETNVKNSLVGLQAKRELENAIKSNVGKPAPNFEKIDIYGNKIKLSDFKNINHVLLVFWASWCEPCIKAVPVLKKINDSYHARGLRMISISWDFYKKNCMEAIQKEETTEWTQIFPLSDTTDKDPWLKTTYDIPHIPCYILIDLEGNIIGKFENGIAALEKKLLDIFSKQEH